MMVWTVSVYQMGRQHVGIEAPYADAEMADEQAVFRVHFDAVRSRRASGELDGDTCLGDRAVGHERQAPDLLRSCNGDITVLLRRGQRDAVWARHVGAQAVQRAVGPQPIDT